MIRMKVTFMLVKMTLILLHHWSMALLLRLKTEQQSNPSISWCTHFLVHNHIVHTTNLGELDLVGSCGLRYFLVKAGENGTYTVKRC